MIKCYFVPGNCHRKIGQCKAVLESADKTQKAGVTTNHLIAGGAGDNLQPAGTAKVLFSVIHGSKTRNE